jgi:probable F420-dependent oxidoreductase
VEVGVKFPLTSGPEIADLARKAEAEGYDWVWMSERVAVPVDKPHPYEPSIDPWIGLAFIAAATQRISLGTVVSQIALRDPVLMARELATLDILSVGRVVVGAGAGWVDTEFEATNIPFDTRGGRLNEFVQVLRSLWTQPEKGWDGKFFKVPPAHLVKPRTPGGPPIWIGAANDAGLRRVARYADGFLAGNLPTETLAQVKERLLSERARLGKTGYLPVHAQVLPPETVDAAREMVEKYTAAGVDGLILSEALARAPGFPPDEVGRALLGFAHG